MPEQGLVGQEVPARWPGAPRQIRTPEKAITETDFHGVVHWLTERIVEQTPREASKWLCDDRDRRIAISIWADELHTRSLQRMLDRLLGLRGIRRLRAIFELTERTVARNKRPKLERLAAACSLLCGDGLGKGYSSLS